MKSDILSSVRHIALDLDGTIYLGGQLFPPSLPFLETLREQGIAYSFLTNNSSRSKHSYLSRLRELGIDVAVDQVATSTDATVDYLREEYPDVGRLFVLGTADLRDELQQLGFELTHDDPADEPDGVLVAFDSDLSYGRLCRAAHWIASGKLYLATHPDRVCPTPEPTVLLDCGAICAALESATGRRPDAVLGKPDARMLTTLMKHHGLAAHEVAMVGDRLYTDMVMARAAGAVAVLVLTGEAKASDLQDHPDVVDLVVADVGELGDLIQTRPQH